MPIKITRPNFESQLDRMTYRKGVDIRDDVLSYLRRYPYGFTANTLSARIQTSAAPIMIENVLSSHPDDFSHALKDGNIYWFVNKEN